MVSINLDIWNPSGFINNRWYNVSHTTIIFYALGIDITTYIVVNISIWKRQYHQDCTAVDCVLIGYAAVNSMVFNCVAVDWVAIGCVLVTLRRSEDDAFPVEVEKTYKLSLAYADSCWSSIKIVRWNQMLWKYLAIWLLMVLRKCTSNTIRSFSASRSSKDYVTFEIYHCSFLQALNESADNYFVSVSQDYHNK